MAKRELIDREKAENITWEEPSYTDALNVLTEVRDKIRELPVIAEQDIVKPYLEKLKADIEKKHTKAKQRGSVLQMNAYTDCLQMIDNLLSESEGKE